jgi:hypothetical protein
MPPVDSFWHGPSEIWDRDDLKGKPENQVTESLMYSMLGSSLRGFGTHVVKMNEFENLLEQYQVPNLFPLKNHDGTPYYNFHQYAARSLSALTNIAHLAQMMSNFTKTHCDQPYTHVLLTRLDLLLYGFPNLPVTPPNMALFIEGNGFNIIDPGNIRRNLHLPFLFNGTTHLDPKAPHFNDQMVWVPWPIFEKLAQANVVALKAWRENTISPNMESSLYNLLKKLGLAEHILPYDIVPFTIYRGAGERDSYNGPYPEIPFVHQGSVENQSEGWIDMETCPKP